MIAALANWPANVSLPVIGAVIFALTFAAGFGGYWLKRAFAGGIGQHQANLEGILLSAILGLLALLLGFTYSLAINRFEIRRELVLQEANAIGTTYLRVQLLGEPHRSRISSLLKDYTANRIALAKTGARPGMLARNDRLITDLWTAEAAAFDSIKALPFANASLETMNNLIDLDSARKAARRAHIPSRVFALLALYMIVTGGAMGYVLSGVRARLAATTLLVMFTLALLLVIDIDRPTEGIRESQGPMEATLATMSAQPPGTFDRYRSP